MEIKVARESEINDARRVALAAHRSYAAVLEPTAYRKLRRGVSRIGETARDGTLLVAETNAEIIGAVVYVPPGAPKPEIFEAGWAIIRLLSVLPGHRGQGIGRLLVEECVRRARTDGAGKVALHTGDFMVAAKRIYDRIGFEEVREIKPRFGFRYRIYARPLVPG